MDSTTAWHRFVDSMVERLGPHAADALNAFRDRLTAAARQLAARGLSAALMRACMRPAVGAAYLQMLASLGITPEPPTPAFVDRLIDDALRGLNQTSRT